MAVTKTRTSRNDTPNTPDVSESKIAQMKVDELRRKLKSRGVKGTEDLKKPDLVKKLIKAEVKASSAKSSTRSAAKGGKNPTSHNDTPNTPEVSESKIARMKASELRTKLTDLGVKGTGEMKKPELVERYVKAELKSVRRTKVAASKASASGAPTSKASIAKAAASKASGSKTSSSKASGSAASGSKATGSKATGSKASASKASTAKAGTSKASTAKAGASKSSSAASSPSKAAGASKSVSASRTGNAAKSSAATKSSSASKSSNASKSGSASKSSNASKSSAPASGNAAKAGTALRSGEKAGGKRTGKKASKSLDYSQEITSTSDKPERDGRSLVTTDHEVIRQWAKARRAVPSSVAGTAHDGHLGVLRFDFPGYSGDGLVEVSWAEWFEAFDKRRLNFIYQERRSGGEPSNFFQLENPDQ